MNSLSNPHCLHYGDDVTIDYVMHYGMLHCDTDTRTVICKSLDIDLIHGDSHGRLCKNIHLNTVDNPFSIITNSKVWRTYSGFFTLHDVIFIMMQICLRAVRTLNVGYAYFVECVFKIKFILLIIFYTIFWTLLFQLIFFSFHVSENIHT